MDTENPSSPTGLRVLVQKDQDDVVATLEWQESVDNVTPGSEMIYSACSSKDSNDISSFASCQNLANSTKGSTKIHLRMPSTEANGPMYFRVIAKDEAGNASISTTLGAVITPNRIDPDN